MPSSEKPQSPLCKQLVKATLLHDNHYPLWQGPYAEGPLGGITQSMIGRFLCCRERFRLKYILGLEPYPKWNHRLGYGTMWHICEEAHAKDSSPHSWGQVFGALQQHFEQMTNLFPMQREELYKWYMVCRTQFPEYVKYWENHSDVQNRHPVMQEQVFDVPYNIPSGRVVRLRGRWDSVDIIPAHTDSNGREWPTGIWLQENKTREKIDQLQVEHDLQFDLQTMMYILALDLLRTRRAQATSAELSMKLGDRPILGVRYNVVRRPLGSGKGSITPHKAKYFKNKTVPAETEEDFYERLRRDYLEDDPGYWFFRVRAVIGPEDLRTFLRTCLDPILETICDWYDYVCNWNENEKTSYVTATGLHYRMPYGVYNALTEQGATEYDSYLATGSEVGLRRTEELFVELK